MFIDRDNTKFVHVITNYDESNILELNGIIFASATEWVYGSSEEILMESQKLSEVIIKKTMSLLNN